MTLVEMLVATLITLLLVYGLASAFAAVSRTIADSRATMEMAGQIRGVALQLQQDLEGVTLPVRPGISSSAGQGYFEYREGPVRDYDAVNRPNDSHIGDYDDIVMLTTRNTEQPFRGRIEQQYLGALAPQSTVAEVIWWMRLEDTNGDGLWSTGERFTLHRRTLLVLPELNNPPATRSATQALPFFPTATSLTNLDQFINDNDLSVHVESVAGGVQVVANTLADLSVRANRFAHLPLVRANPPNPPYPPAGFPSILDLTGGLLSTTYALDGTRVGEDVVLANCIAFDMKAYDPLVPVQQDASGIDALTPNDPGFGAAGNSAVGTGAFVDLNYAGTSGLSLFSGPPSLRSGLSGLSGQGQRAGRRYSQPAGHDCYDTWSLDYEMDGINQDMEPPGPPPEALFPDEWFDPIIPNVTNVDEGMDGEDNLEWVLVPGSGYLLKSQHGTDDVGERETSPPYPVPLRGVRATLRIYEPDSRQVRQATVVSDFTPQ